MKALYSVNETNELIRSGKCLLVAGDEKLLSQLEKGRWIGGTIPYFMGDDGGVESREVLQVTQVPEEAELQSIRSYSTTNISKLPTHYHENGFSHIILPGFSDIHRIFGEQGTTWPGLFTRPLVGWVSGRHLESTVAPKVINGETGRFSTDEAVVLHFSLPPNRFAKVNIINLFEEGSGDVIKFMQPGFEASDCTVNGRPTNFSDYLTLSKKDVKIPLVADFFGAKINVCVQNNDTQAKRVALFAPVFPGVEYRFGNPVPDYEAEFAKRIAIDNPNPVFMCNCVLNFAYANLEKKKTGTMTGPMTFGEIAYMLLNQTLVYMTIEE